MKAKEDARKSKNLIVQPHHQDWKMNFRRKYYRFRNKYSRYFRRDFLHGFFRKYQWQLLAALFLCLFLFKKERQQPAAVSGLRANEHTLEKKPPTKEVKSSLLFTPHLPEISTITVEKKWDMQTITDTDIRNYIHRFAATVRSEQEKMKIPASVTMSLAILQSVAGKTDLALRGNNHFMMTIRENILKTHTIGNIKTAIGDYAQYSTAWASFRANSLNLQKKYPHLLGNTSYKTWIEELQKEANDKEWQAKLLYLIENYRLYELDK